MVLVSLSHFGFFFFFFFINVFPAHLKKLTGSFILSVPEFPSDVSRVDLVSCIILGSQ